jgi:hypothetical protein
MSITHVLPDTTLPISGNIDTTFNQLFHLVPPVGPQAYGKVSMPDQRAPITSEMFGDKGDATVWSDVPLQAAHDALVNGGTIQGGSGHYLLQNTVWFKNRVRYIGAGPGHNPQVGGTYFQPSSTFAHTAQPVFKITAGAGGVRGLLIASDTTDKLNQFTGIQCINDGAAQPGEILIEDVKVNGCGIGLDLGVVHDGRDVGCRVLNYRVAGVRMGGVAGRNCGVWRSTDLQINNGGFTTWAIEATTDSNLVRVNDASNAALGNEITVDGVTILTITGVTGNLLMLSGNVTVGVNAPVRFAYHLAGVGVEVLGNAADVRMFRTLIAGGRHGLHLKGTAGAGWRVPEAIELIKPNVTVTTHEAVLVERVNYLECGGHIGDTPWSSVVRIAGIDAGGDPDHNCAEGVSFEGAKIAGGGKHGVDWQCGRNLVVGDVHSNNLSGGDFSNVHRGAGARGEFRAVGRNLANGLLNGSQGMAVASITTDPAADVLDVIDHNVTV